MGNVDTNNLERIQERRRDLINFCISAVILIMSSLIGYIVYEKKAERKTEPKELIDVDCRVGSQCISMRNELE